MATLASTWVAPRTGESRTDRPLSHGVARGGLECLIVSPSLARRETLAQAATDSGWSSVVCGDADSARRLAGRIAVKLAIVDLEKASPADCGALRQLSADLARMGGALLVVCGADGDVQQEIWARQLGAWLYLPGMSGGDDMSLLCQEARQVVEKTTG